MSEGTLSSSTVMPSDRHESRSAGTSSAAFAIIGNVAFVVSCVFLFLALFLGCLGVATLLFLGLGSVVLITLVVGGFAKVFDFLFERPSRS